MQPASPVIRTFDEWTIPTPDIPLRQGDLLVSREPKTGTIEAICLTITADCDMSNKKFGTDVACLRVMAIRDYWRTIWAARKLRRLIETETEKVRVQLNKWNAQRLSGESSLSLEAVTDWVQNSQPTDICNDLAIPQDQSKKVLNSLGCLRAALVNLDTSKGSDELTQFVAFRSSLLGKSPADCLREAITQAQSEDLQEDAFLLPSLPQLQIAPVVVMLRGLVPVPFKSICYRASDAASDTMFLRIGRLQPVFKYAVSQAFGNLYSRIGLPPQYEARCEAAVANIDPSDWH